MIEKGAFIITTEEYCHTLNIRKMVRSNSTRMVRNMRLMDMLESSKGFFLEDVGEWIWKVKVLSLHSI